MKLQVLFSLLNLGAAFISHSKPQKLKLIQLNLIDVENVDDFDDDLEETPKKNITPKNVFDLKGIASYSDKDKKELSAEVRKAVAQDIDTKIRRVQILKEELAAETKQRNEELADISNKRAELASQVFGNRVDSIVDDFLTKTESGRQATKMAAAADARMVGKGLTLGSWGVDKYGRAVLMNTDGVVVGEGEASSKGLFSTKYLSELDEKGELKVTKKCLLVTGDKVDSPISQVVDKLSKMLQVDGIEVFTSTANLARIGGSDASTCIILPGAAEDGNRVNQLVDRIRTPTSSNVHGPPSHIIYVATLGTERSSEYPYNLQNMFRQLDKKLGGEEALKSTAALTREAGQQAADYTIVKIGAVLPDRSNLKKGSASEEEKKKFAALDGSVCVALQPGDSLDGDVVVDDLVSVLYQASVLQPVGNSTISFVSLSENDNQPNQDEWDDLFTKTVGPELQRISIDSDGEKDFGLVSAFIEEWSKTFEGPKTGLTTPVTVEKVPSKDLAEGSFAIQIKFMVTNTGTNYKSSAEERAEEKFRSNPNNKTPTNGGKAPAATRDIKIQQKRKEGGIEILVEKYPFFRVRARRCNMDEKTVIKEMSEQTILKRLRDQLAFFLNNKDHL